METTKPAVSGGLFEICVGVPDLGEAIMHWRAFGYRPGPTGSLAAAQAKTLYGVDSGLRSVRLLHQDSDHGLIRLMQWDKPKGAGLNMAPLRTIGNRWTVHKSHDIMTAANHAEIWERQGKPIRRVGPLMNERVRGSDAAPNVPFGGPVTCLRELEMCVPLYQHVLMQRFNVHIPLYGQVNEDSLLRTSQACHAGIFIDSGDMTIADIYEHGFGLQRTARYSIGYNPDSIGSVMFEMEPGDTLTITDYDDARAGPGSAQRSGRLRVFLLQTTHPQVDRRPDARPGNLGYSLYTYRVKNLDAMRAHLQSHGAHQMSAVATDEFGTRACSFRAPDGYDWTFVEAG